VAVRHCVNVSLDNFRVTQFTCFPCLHPFFPPITAKRFVFRRVCRLRTCLSKCILNETWRSFRTYYLRLPRTLRYGCEIAAVVVAHETTEAVYANRCNLIKLNKSSILIIIRVDKTFCIEKFFLNALRSEFYKIICFGQQKQYVQVHVI